MKFSFSSPAQPMLASLAASESSRAGCVGDATSVDLDVPFELGGVPV